MLEFKSVIKTLIFTVVLIMLMQIKIENRSIERHFFSWTRSSSIGNFLNKTAEGAVLVIHQSVAFVKKATGGSQGSSLGDSISQKASRINLDFQRLHHQSTESSSTNSSSADE
jgi:hypothetical protein